MENSDGNGQELGNGGGEASGVEASLSPSAIDLIRNQRKPLRAHIQLLGHSIETALKEDGVDWLELNAKAKVFLKVGSKIQVLDNDVWRQHTLTPLSEADEQQEMMEQNDYSLRLEILLARVESMRPVVESVSSKNGNARENEETNSQSSMMAAFANNSFAAPKLPEFQIPSFDGDIKKFRTFWGMFSRIHAHPALSASDKFGYLVQSLKSSSEASDIISAYDMDGENYDHAVKALCDWYGNRDKQLSISMKELLKFVIAQGNAKDKLSLRKIHFKLESFINTLESLDIDKADPTAWLVQMVESCLPTPILRSWKSAEAEKEKHKPDEEKSKKSELKRLMAHIRVRVNIDHDVELSQSSYVDRQKEDSRKPKEEQNTRRAQKRRFPALHGFHVSVGKYCIFCETSTHDSLQCYRANGRDYAENRNVAYKKRKCFLCLKDHLASECKETDLKCKDCEGPHVTVMCPEKRRGQKKGAAIGKREKVAKSSTTFANIVVNSDVILQTLLVRVKNGTNEKIVRAFVDEGSMKSYILTSTVQQMDLKYVKSVKESQILMGNHITPAETRRMFHVTLEALNGGFNLTTAIRQQKKICSSLPQLGRNSDLTKELKNMGIKLSDDNRATKEIELLIGADIIGSIRTGKMHLLKTGAVATETGFGWTVLGPTSCEESDSDTCVVTHMNVTLSGKNIAKLWDLETLGIQDPIEVLSAAQKEEDLKRDFCETTKRDADGRYIVKLPWKKGHPPLPHNRHVAVQRLMTTAASLRKKGYYEKYGNLLMEWEKEGFIEKMPPGSVGSHYIPHRPVYKESSTTTPVRPVFDASCPTSIKLSFNDSLEKGTNFITLIPEVLLRFREKKVGFVADIKKAFQQITVDETDRDYLRFLWYSENGEVVEFRHARVLFGAICSPFLLGAVLELHLRNVPGNRKEFGRRLLEAFYVDNCVSSVDTLEEYHNFRKESVEIMSDAKMELRLWFSSLEDLDNPDEEEMPVLGMVWNRKHDFLYVKIPEMGDDKKVTKRTLLSSSHKIFDPKGIVAPATVPMRKVLQRAWVKKKPWDIPLDEDDLKEFLKWKEEVKELEKVRIPRLATGGVTDRKSWTFHVFSDASGKVYGAVVFLRTEFQGEVSVELLLAKPRLAPIPKAKKGETPKPISIARLELMGCLLGVRLYRMVKSAFDNQCNNPEGNQQPIKAVFHTDSKVALAWIRRNDPWNTFVCNRTKEINEHTDTSSWRHVPGTENPADLLSRGCSPAQLVRSKWWKGPKWLYLAESQWPHCDDTPDEEEVYVERASANEQLVTPCVSFMSIVNDRVKAQHSFHTLVRIAGWLRRFCHNAKKNKEARVQQEDLSESEIVKAEVALIRHIQNEFLKKHQSELGSLHTFKDDDEVLRVKTKLTNLPGCQQFKFPAVLPGKAPETQQLIMNTHYHQFHGGVGIVMTKLREKYWILKARQTVRYVLSRCTICRRFRAKPAATIPAPLPLDRVKTAEPFEVTGVDVGGPIYLEDGTKVYFVIFTCAVYRGVHFVVITSLSAVAFIEALKTFVKRYRRPAIIYSDNGTNFRGADNLCSKLEWDEISKHELVRRIRWKFNPAASPWWTGFIERLIGLAKELLYRVVGKRVLTQDELERVLDGVAEVMNNRPLTYISEDPEDLEPLTPAHFLHPFGSIAFPEETLTLAQNLRHRYKYVQTLKQELQGRFQKEYLAQLVHNRKMKPTRELRVGELVFIGNDNQKRLFWKLGKIVHFIEGAQGVKRVAAVKTSEGVITRSVQRLYPLEAEAAEERDILRTRYGREIRTPKRFKLN